MKHDREARRIGRPTTKFNRDGEAGPRRRPQWVCKGSPSTREARHRQYNDTLGSRSTPEAQCRGYGKPVGSGGPQRSSTETRRPVHAGGPDATQGKPVHAGGPISTIQRRTWKPVHAGGQTKCNREARRSGKPTMATNMDEETDLSRRPQGVRVCVYGKPVDAGSPVSTARAHTRKPNHAGGQLKHNREARTGRRPTAMTIN